MSIVAVIIMILLVYMFRVVDILKTPFKVILDSCNSFWRGKLDRSKKAILKRKRDIYEDVTVNEVELKELKKLKTEHNVENEAKAEQINKIKSEAIPIVSPKVEMAEDDEDSE